MTDTGPAWPTQPAPERKRLDLKLVIPVLIGLVSVSGAVVAWRSSQAGEYATDKDRQAVAETVIVAQVDAGNEIVVHDARSRFADHLAADVNAELLQQQADAATDPDRAAALEDEAEEQRVIAQRVLEGGTSPVLLGSYIVRDDDGNQTFDEARFRDDLELASDARNQVNPSQTVREANRLRNESQRLDGFLIAMVAAVVVLTVAQISVRRSLRLGLAGVGTVMWIATSVLAITGAY